MPQKYIILDLCGTLYYSNTTYELLDMIIKKRSYHFLRRAMKCRVVTLANNAIYRIFHIDLLRAKALSYLKGFSKKEIYKACTTFYNEILVPRKVETTHNLMHKYISEGYTPIIVSGTIKPVAEVIAQKLNIEQYIASDLEFSNNICTGKLTSDLLNSKATTLQKMGICPPYGVVITDNTADVEIIRNSNMSYIVTYNNIQRWEKKKLKNISYIDTQINANTPSR